MPTILTPEERALISKVLQEMFHLGLPAEDGLNTVVDLARYAALFQHDRGIEAMYDYIAWTKANGKTDEVLTTIRHDLDGMFDALFLPRTLGYLGPST